MAAPAIALAVGKIQTFLLNFESIAAATANIGRFRLPQKARIVRVGASAQAKTAGLAAFTLMVEAGGTNVLSAAMNLHTPAAGTFVEGSITAAHAVQEAETEITVDVDSHTAGGETASFVTVQVDYLPED